MAYLIPLELNWEDAMDEGCISDDGSSAPSSPRTPVMEPLPMPPPKEPPSWKIPVVSRSLPHTAEEWKQTLGGVKREYQNRRYRSCSTRCLDVLDNVRYLDTLEAAYLIFLHFYAASAMEMQVRSLHHASAHRVRLLRQARDHYVQASKLVQIEDECITRPWSGSPSISSATGSPAPSESFHSCVSTVMSSPTPSPCQGDCEVRPLDLARRERKQVAFRDECVPDLIIRPDSPTLGLDDWTGCSSPALDIAISQSQHESVKDPDALPASALVLQDIGDGNAFSAGAYSIRRYCNLLAGLQRQLSTHIAFVAVDLAAAENPVAQLPSDDEFRALALQARIERLRANHWQRRRFDAQRYEALRESAMADMME